MPSDNIGWHAAAMAIDLCTSQASFQRHAMLQSRTRLACAGALLQTAARAVAQDDADVLNSVLDSLRVQLGDTQTAQWLIAHGVDAAGFTLLHRAVALAQCADEVASLASWLRQVSRAWAKAREAAAVEQEEELLDGEEDDELTDNEQQADARTDSLDDRADRSHASPGESCHGAVAGTGRGSTQPSPAQQRRPWLWGTGTMRPGFEVLSHLDAMALRAALPADSLESAGEYVGPLLVLLAAGASPSARDVAGSTPLHLAAAAGNLGAVHVLLKAGADPLAAMPDGSRPVHAAITAGHVDVARVLASSEAAKRSGAGSDSVASDDGAGPACVAELDVVAQGLPVATLLRGAQPARFDPQRVAACAGPGISSESVLSHLHACTSGAVFPLNGIAAAACAASDGWAALPRVPLAVPRHVQAPLPVHTVPLGAVEVSNALLRGSMRSLLRQICTAPELARSIWENLHSCKSLPLLAACSTDRMALDLLYCGAHAAAQPDGTALAGTRLLRPALWSINAQVGCAAAVVASHRATSAVRPVVAAVAAGALVLSTLPVTTAQTQSGPAAASVHHPSSIGPVCALAQQESVCQMLPALMADRADSRSASAAAPSQGSASVLVPLRNITRIELLDTSAVHSNRVVQGDHAQRLAMQLRGIADGVVRRAGRATPVHLARMAQAIQTSSAAAQTSLVLEASAAGRRWARALHCAWPALRTTPSLRTPMASSAPAAQAMELPDAVRASHSSASTAWSCTQGVADLFLACAGIHVSPGPATGALSPSSAWGKGTQAVVSGGPGAHGTACHIVQEVAAISCSPCLHSLVMAGALYDARAASAAEKRWPASVPSSSELLPEHVWRDSEAAWAGGTGAAAPAAAIDGASASSRIAPTVLRIWASDTPGRADSAKVAAVLQFADYATAAGATILLYAAQQLLHAQLAQLDSLLTPSAMADLLDLALAGLQAPAELAEG